MKNEIAANYLVGKGIELGALNNPLTVDPKKADVEYADRLPKVDALRLFPELEDIADSIIEPSLLLDLDTDDLSQIKQADYDFVIANHVIEHVVNPIQFLKNISNSLKESGFLFLTVPDKDFTLDKRRQLTSNAHLLHEYEQGTKHLSNDHIKDFLLYKEPVKDIHPAIKKYFEENGLPLSYYDGNKLPLNPFTRRRLYQFHRSRSIHVHVWNRNSFDEFLNFAIKEADLKFTIVETHDPNQVVGEAIYLLERTRSS
jgi:SAM-dependent methyltransferase